MNVRRANWNDLKQIAILTRMHYNATDFPVDVRWSDEALEQFLDRFVIHPECALFVSTEGPQLTGVLAVQKATAFFSTDVAARELFLYIKPEYRGQHAGVGMIRLAEAWAVENGCNLIIVGNHPLSPPHVHYTYLRHGYRQAQTDYFKRLTPLC